MGRKHGAQLIGPKELKQKTKVIQDKRGRSIRRRIVWGYVMLYFVIALIAMVTGVIVWYVSCFFQVQDYIADDLQRILSGISFDDNHGVMREPLNQALPSSVIDYNLYLNYSHESTDPETGSVKYTSGSVFLFSKNGDDALNEKIFDADQHYSPISNLREPDRMHIIAIQSITSLKDHSAYGSHPAYAIHAVIDTARYPMAQSAFLTWGISLLITYVFVIALGLVLVIVYGAARTRKYLLPIQDITALASQLGSNNLNMRLDVDSARHELKELVLAINTMLDRIYGTYIKQRRFVSDVSHELRTPISVINGYANMLKRWAKDDKVVFDESVDAIIEEAENMKYLVENLLFLARSDSRTLTYDMEVFDLSELITGIAKTTKLVDNGKHEITSQIAPSIMCLGDRSRIKQAVRAFVENALKYTPPSGNISIVLESDQRQAKIIIKDTGIGISKKDMGHIFRRFYRGDRSRNRKDGGYGLGLAIAKAIIVVHNGKIKLSSQESKGTTATITLPL